MDGRRDGFPNGPWDVPAQAFTDWQDRDPEQSLQSLDTQLTQLVQAARGRAGTRELLDRLNQAEQTLIQIQTDQAFAQWASSREVERFGELHAAWNNAANRAFGLYAQARQDLLQTNPGPEVPGLIWGMTAKSRCRLPIPRNSWICWTGKRNWSTPTSGCWVPAKERCTVTDQGVTYQESSLLAAYEDGTLSEADYWAAV